jgi:hypothetical protein
METIHRKWRAAASDQVLLRNQLRGHLESTEGKIDYIYHQFVERSFGSIRLFDVYFSNDPLCILIHPWVREKIKVGWIEG